VWQVFIKFPTIFSKFLWDGSDNFTAISGFNSPNSDGAHPEAGLILSGNNVFGTTYYGGGSGEGSIFSISLGQLTIILSGGDVILTWPTNAAGLTLQFVTNLVAPVVWNAASPAPVVFNGQNTVTNPISGTQRFYRLNQ
jgi:uncharacterized repeat protein (TIGR03803 family)